MISATLLKPVILKFQILGGPHITEIEKKYFFPIFLLLKVDFDFEFQWYCHFDQVHYMQHYLFQYQFLNNFHSNQA